MVVLVLRVGVLEVLVEIMRVPKHAPYRQPLYVPRVKFPRICSMKSSNQSVSIDVACTFTFIFHWAKSLIFDKILNATCRSSWIQNCLTLLTAINQDGWQVLLRKRYSHRLQTRHMEHKVSLEKIWVCEPDCHWLNDLLDSKQANKSNFFRNLGYWSRATLNLLVWREDNTFSFYLPLAWLLI